MAYIPYPERQATPNGYQIAGQAFSQVGKSLGDYEDRQQKLRAFMEEMTLKRAQALRAQQEADDLHKKAELDAKLKSEEEQRAHDFALEVAKGKQIAKADPALARRPAKAPPSAADLAALEPDAAPGYFGNQPISGGDPTALMGEALNNYPGEAANGRSPYDRQELADLALQSRQMDAKDYMAATKPEKTTRDRYSVQVVGDRKVRVNLDTGEEMDIGPAPKTRDRFSTVETGGRKVRINMDTGEQTDIGPVTVKPMSPKDQATAKSKITMLTLARQQLQNVQDKFDSIKGSAFSAGPGVGHIPTPSGKAFDAAVDGMRNTITGLTRVPGVGAMSDFETKLSQAANPSRTGYESITQQQIDQMAQMINTLESGYQGMLPDIEETPPGPGAGSPARPAPGAAAHPKAAAVRKVAENILRDPRATQSDRAKAQKALQRLEGN